MTEVQIKEHQRKSKNGKSVTVKGYTRRVGRKGVHSPKKDKSTAAGSGEEFQAKKASATKEKPKYTGPQMTEEEITRVLNEEMNKQMAENQKQYEQENFPNKKAGEAFLNENKKDRTIIELKNGLQYKIIDPGWGKLAPLVTDTIFISFKVYTIKNELIYNSQDYSAMTKIQLGSAIPAFQEILPKIKTGGSVRIFTSYEYAYGSEVYKKDKVKPYETLIFDVIVNKIRLNAERLNEFNRLNEIEPTGQQTNQQ